MPRKPKSTVKYLTELNLELSKELHKAERKIREQETHISLLKDALRRPSLAVFSDNQLSVLLEFIQQTVKPDQMRVN